MTNKKVVAGFEVVLMVVSFFAFGYFTGFSEIGFVSAEEEEDVLDKIDEAVQDFGDEVGEAVQDFGGWLDDLGNSELIVESSWDSYPISAVATDVGCCFVNLNGQACSTAAPENCLSDSPFVEGALCANTEFCEKGCCYDDSTGIYNKNVLEVACAADWTNDPNCNLPGANLGCCVLGSDTVFGTRGQCEVDSLARGFGDDGFVDWSRDIGEVECLILSETQEEGACVFAGGGCKFESEVECNADLGDFYVDILCTSPSLDTNCEMTEQTRCEDGGDKVFFVDNCGNLANVYDSARVDDESYWDEVIEGEDLCGAGEGNAESDDCGNCNPFLGGTCGVAGEGDVDIGGFYCEDVGCDYNINLPGGKTYKHGESWCIYDGAIGDGDDVVGSRHWEANCNRGQITTIGCKDYRNYICIQSEGVEFGGEYIEFNNAACVPNNWRECVGLNGEEDSIEKCGETLNCRVETIDIADEFKFDVCLPKYPAGFNPNEMRPSLSGETVCGMADTTCTVIRKPKGLFSSKCKYVANEGCMSEKFGQKMNDFCRGLGDCGGSVNIAGKFSDSYKIIEVVDGSDPKSRYLSSDWISDLKDLANPVPGQFAPVEDYSEFLGQVNVLGEVSEEGEDIDMSGVAAGLAGMGYAAGVIATGSLSFSLKGLAVVGQPSIVVANFPGASMAAFSGAAIGAGIGMIVGGMIAKQMGLSEGGSILMATGGGLVGGALTYSYITGAGWVLGPIGWLGLGIMALASFFSGADCDPIEVNFECKMWSPPVGGSDCDKCNSGLLNPDGTRQCSPYRCESLGAACELINRGSDDELCFHVNEYDITPPMITHPEDNPNDNVSYEDTSDGVNIVGIDGGCLEANTYLTFGVITSKPAQCVFDADPATDFEDMLFDFGRSSYLINHTTRHLLEDPSAGQSQGLDWTGELDLYVKCRDRNGIVSPIAYEISLCVAEGDDIWGPRIQGSSTGDMLVSVDKTSQDVVIITNELADCRWDLLDVNYSLMGNELECSDDWGSPSHVDGYVCDGVVPVSNNDTTYYVRCMDQPWLDVSEANEGSYSFSIRKPDVKISIDRIKPDSDDKVNTDLITVDLRIATSGGGDFHFCSWSISGYDDMNPILETGNDRTHSVDINSRTGDQKFYVECRDELGDFDRSMTEFEIARDSSSPVIARIWQDGGRLNVVTTEDSECKYSVETCRFGWSEGASAGDGTEHAISVVRGETYYIKCADEFGNMPNGCSVEVVAT